MGQFPLDRENGQKVTLFYFDQTVWFFQLELFEVDDIGDDGDYDL